MGALNTGLRMTGTLVSQEVIVRFLIMIEGIKKIGGTTS